MNRPILKGQQVWITIHVKTIEMSPTQFVRHFLKTFITQMYLPNI